jgi:transposase
MFKSDQTAEPRFRAFAAIDWGDRKHFFAVQDAATGCVERGSLEHTPEQVRGWVEELLSRFDGGPIAVALEQSRGALLAQLTHYQGLVIYPVHPVTAARLREAFTPSGAKDDQPDADLLLDLLQSHRDRLRPLEPDTTQTRTLQLLVEQRRKMVDEKTRQKNRLTAELKLYFPQALSWFSEVDAPTSMRFLRRWPTLEHAQRARPATLLRFFEQQRSRGRERNRRRLEAIRQAVPATRDPAVIAGARAIVPTLLELLEALSEGIVRVDQQIGEIVAGHEDYPLFSALPGAGRRLAPRLLAAFGTRRERFACAGEMQAYSGIAPVLERSGSRRRVRFRRACPRFVRQTFHEFARCSTQYSVWAGAYYQQQRARGRAHHHVIRSLAFKWIRILFRCWQSRTPYDEARYLETLAQRASPLAAQALAAVETL